MSCCPLHPIISPPPPLSSIQLNIAGELNCTQTNQQNQNLLLAAKLPYQKQGFLLTTQ